MRENTNGGVEAVANHLKICFVAVLAMLGVLVSLPTVATAEIAPYAEDTWGVYNSVTSGTLTDRIDNEVFAIEQIGGTVYVGGKFTEVRNWSGATPVTTHPYLAAFSASTGAFISSFDADLGGPVYSLQASPDGSRLFVGGEFGDVQGVANTQALVALDPTSGAVDSSWKAQLKQDGRAVVYTMDLDGTWLYVGGSFDAIGGANAVPLTTFGKAAKLSLSNGAPDLNWKPIAEGGGVWGIAVSNNGSSVYLAGYFDEINNVNGTHGFVGVDNNNGQSIRPGRLPHNNNGRRWYQDVLVTDGLVFVAGMEHITYVLNESDLSVRTLHSTGGTNNAEFQMGGDYQDLEQVGNRVYASCHCRNNHYADGDVFRFRLGGPATWSRVDPIKFVAAYSAVDGSYDPSFQLDISGSSGVWAIHGATDGCLWLGGDITRASRSDGTNQPRGAFTRHCDPAMAPDTERPSTPSGLTATSGADSVSLSWNASTDNVGVASYDVYRSATNGGAAIVVGSSETTTYVDPGLGAGEYWYYLRAMDAAGNTSWRTGYRSAIIGAAADTERPGQASGYVAVANGADSAVLSWNPASDNVGVTGYNVYRAGADGGPYSIVATPATSPYVDSGLVAGDYWYYLRAVDAAGNEGWRTAKRMVTIGGEPADTQRPSTPRGLLGSNITTDSVTLNWQASTDNVGVANYLIYNNATGTVVATVTSTTALVSGLDSGTSYTFYVKAIDAAGNTSWRSNLRAIATL